jgi:hypothetical protein
VAGSCEHVDESPGSIKCGEFLDWLRTCEPLKVSAPWSLVVRWLVYWLVLSNRNGNELGLLGSRLWYL